MPSKRSYSLSVSRLLEVEAAKAGLEDCLWQASISTAWNFLNCPTDNAVGGLSFFSTREGFIADNVINYEIVLASGEIVNTNKNENTDLLIALRGGGNNFGIVTRYDLRTFKQGSFWGGSVY